MSDVLTDDEKRIKLLKMGVHVISALLYEEFKKDFNVILITCPAGEKTVSLMSRCESEETLQGIATVFMNTLEKRGDGEVLQ